MDVYSFGVILYRMLCGRYPFRTNSRMELLRQVLEDPPQPPRQLTHAIPKQLEELCLACLSRNSDSRPTSASVASQLREILTLQAEDDSYDSVGSTLSQVPSHSTTPSPPNPQRRCLQVEVAGTDSAEPATVVPLNTIATLLELDGAERCGSGNSSPIFRLPPLAGSDDWINWFSNASHRVLTLVSGGLREASDDSTVSIRLNSLVGDERPEGDGRKPSVWKELVCRVEATVSAHSVDISEDSSRFLERGLARSPEDTRGGTVTLLADDGTALVVSVRDATSEDGNPLTGRTAQSSIMKSRWEQTREGMGQVVLLMGSEGTGKTRLIRQLLGSIRQHDASHRPIIWTCRPPQQTHAFHPLLEWLQNQATDVSSEQSARTATGLSDVLEDWSLDRPKAHELLATEMGLMQADADNTPLAENRRREQITEVLLDWLAALAKQSPVLFVLEDLQWIDAATLNFVERLVDRESNNRLLTMLSCRSEFESPWGSRAHQTQVALNRLTTRQIRELAEAVSGHSLDADAIADIKTRTNGIPLLIEHHARYRLAK